MSLIPYGFGMDPFAGMGTFGGGYGGMGGGGMLGFPTTSSALTTPFGDVDRQLLDFSRLASDPLPIDVEERDKEYLVRVHQREAGLRKRDLRVDVENGQLVIRGERERERGDEYRGTYRREYRSVYRSMALPLNVEQDKVEARYEGNQLAIHLPKKPGTEGQRRSIDISGGEEKQGAGAGAGAGTSGAGMGTTGGMGTIGASTSGMGTTTGHGMRSGAGTSGGMGSSGAGTSASMGTSGAGTSDTTTSGAGAGAGTRQQQQQQGTSTR